MFVVDWDGTCVKEQWPGMGDWLPGAVFALKEMSAVGKTVIYSLRCHYYEKDDETLRPDGAPEAEAAAIRAMLDEAGLYNVEVYPNGRGKPPGEFYIDDRAIRFTNWSDALAQMRELRRAAETAH